MCLEETDGCVGSLVIQSKLGFKIPLSLSFGEQGVAQSFAEDLGKKLGFDVAFSLTLQCTA